MVAGSKAAASHPGENDDAVLVLEDGSRFYGRNFGAPVTTSGEIGEFFLHFGHS